MRKERDVSALHPKDVLHCWKFKNGRKWHLIPSNKTSDGGFTLCDRRIRWGDTGAEEYNLRQKFEGRLCTFCKQEDDRTSKGKV